MKESKESKINKKEVTSNMMWRFADKWGTQLVSLIISTIIARILEPESYGIITMVNTFINIFSVFADSGLGDSLIQKKDVDDLDYSSAFCANACLCLLVYSALFLSAPLIAKFYDVKDLVIYIRVSSVTIIISSYKNIQHAFVAKNMLFKKYFFASLFGTIGGGVIGVYMAIKGYGVWSLIICNIFDTLFDTLICAFTVEWNLKFKFSYRRLKKLFNFGYKILLANIVQKIYDKLYQLVVGKIYTTSDLAFFDKGDNISNKVTNNIDYTINSVLFPTMSSVQEDKEELKKLAKRMLKLNTYIIYPLIIGLFAVSEEVIEVIFTKKWLPAVPYVKVFCLIRLLLPINSINTNVIKALGKSALYLKQQIIGKIITIIMLLVTIKRGVYMMSVGLLISSLIVSLINVYPNKELLDYGIIDQIKDIIPNILLSILMLISVNYFGNIISANIFQLLFIKVTIGVLTYVLVSILTKNDSFHYLLKIINKNF